MGAGKGLRGVNCRNADRHGEHGRGKVSRIGQECVTCTSNVLVHVVEEFIFVLVHMYNDPYFRLYFTNFAIF